MGFVNGCTKETDLWGEQRDRENNNTAYIPLKKDEEHNEGPLTDAEVKAFADAEAAYQAEQKKLKIAKCEEEKRLRAIVRINKIQYH